MDADSLLPTFVRPAGVRLARFAGDAARSI
jgi:hypothetical protein